MKLWIKKHKTLLITFGVISLVTWIVTLIEINLIAANTDGLKEYAETKVISDDLEVVGLVGMLDITLLIIWTFIFMFIFMKIVFPSKKALQGAFFMEEFRFLKDMPNELRRGLDKNE
ncbi:hypothetical protein [Bacillus sp. GL1(2024)]|uniref:hypothetical protein n=1 Tax=Bacillus sp. GL1(2024) TaxID=3450427 RepID=UPI002890B5E9|nr:hypothetical protein [Bacillus wiedmannii]